MTQSKPLSIRFSFLKCCKHLSNLPNSWYLLTISFLKIQFFFHNENAFSGFSKSHRMYSRDLLFSKFFRIKYQNFRFLRDRSKKDALHNKCKNYATLKSVAVKIRIWTTTKRRNFISDITNVITIIVNVNSVSRLYDNEPLGKYSAEITE